MSKEQFVSKEQFLYGGQVPLHRIFTKRELFAAMLMQGALSNPEGYHADSSSLAASAVFDADALIAALNADSEVK